MTMRSYDPQLYLQLSPEEVVIGLREDGAFYHESRPTSRIVFSRKRDTFSLARSSAFIAQL